MHGAKVRLGEAAKAIRGEGKESAARRCERSKVRTGEARHCETDTRAFEGKQRAVSARRCARSK